MVARAKNVLSLRVPDGEGKISAQMLDALGAPGRVGTQNQIGIGGDAAASTCWPSLLVSFACSSSRQSIRASAVIQSCPSRLAGWRSICDSRVVRSMVWPKPIEPCDQVSRAVRPQ